MRPGHVQALPTLAGPIQPAHVHLERPLELEQHLLRRQEPVLHALATDHDRRVVVNLRVVLVGGVKQAQELSSRHIGRQSTPCPHQRPHQQQTEDPRTTHPHLRRSRRHPASFRLMRGGSQKAFNLSNIWHSPPEVHRISAPPLAHWGHSPRSSTSRRIFRPIRRLPGGTRAHPDVAQVLLGLGPEGGMAVRRDWPESAPRRPPGWRDRPRIRDGTRTPVAGPVAGAPPATRLRSPQPPEAGLRITRDGRCPTRTPTTRRCDPGWRTAAETADRTDTARGSVAPHHLSGIGSAASPTA